MTSKCSDDLYSPYVLDFWEVISLPYMTIGNIWATPSNFTTD